MFCSNLECGVEENSAEILISTIIGEKETPKGKETEQ